VKLSPHETVKFAPGGLHLMCMEPTAAMKPGKTVTMVLEFSDSGPGMREPAKVFDPFYTTKPIGKGTGLGLSATYGVVQNHEGQITCQNKPEGGALFILRFPISKQTGFAASAASED